MPREYARLGPMKKDRRLSVPMTQDDLFRLENALEGTGVSKAEFARQAILNALSEAVSIEPPGEDWRKARGL